MTDSTGKPRKIANFKDATEALKGYYDNAHTKYTLDNMRELMAYLGDPQDKLRILHIAGTSGKTSTAYYAAALLSAAGYKTGLTVSPHVDQINERVQINREPVPEAQFCEALADFLDIIDTGHVKPSWFEAMVAFAYWYFAREGVDYAVIEVGLGGLHDGTNVVTRADKVCIITDIGYDHMAILGNTLAEIATQKAGIIQQDTAVFTYNQAPEIMGQVKERVAQKSAQLLIIKDQKIDLPAVQKLPLFQQRNLTLALAAVRYAVQRDGGQTMTPQQIILASKAIIPGRMEVIKHCAKTFILDGAHNAQKLTAFFESFRVDYPNSLPLVLAGFVEGEEQRWHEAIDVLVQNNVDLVLTDFYSEKDYKKFSVNPNIVADYCATRGLAATVVLEPVKAFTYVMNDKNPLVIVTGSFYLLNHIRPLTLKS
jgi:dihydrofolate synthase/folylpolyglutamate synthase